MPKGPQGQKRPADMIGNAFHIAPIATGQIEETTLLQAAKSNSGLTGPKECVVNTTPAQYQETAQKAAAARWG